MRHRRGSSYARSELSGLITMFQPGDIVKASFINDDGFWGVVRDVRPRENKVYVAWGGGSISQHDPQELMPSLLGMTPKDYKDYREHDEEKVRSATSAALRDLLGDDQRLGDPSLHGLDEPVDGGFSVIRDLAYELHDEAVDEAKRGPRTAFGLHTRRSRHAMYWGAPGRVYRLTRQEQENGEASCPKCGCSKMDLEGFTRGEKMYRCPKCGFKIPTSKVVTDRVKIEIEPDGEVEVTVSGSDVSASVISRRSAVDLLARKQKKHTKPTSGGKKQYQQKKKAPGFKKQQEKAQKKFNLKHKGK